MKSITVTVNSDTGLHARPAGQFVSVASTYKSDIKVKKNDREINGKSIMGILSLCVNTGEEITIYADGVDENEAVMGLNKLFSEGL